MDDQFAESVDGRGTGINQFMSDAGLRAIIHGLHYIAADRPPMAVESRAEERAAGAGPYWYHVNRGDMLNWELDKWGEPLWVLIRECPPATGDPLAAVDARKAGTEHYLLWTREYYQRFKVERADGPDKSLSVTAMPQEANASGRVTIVAVYGDKRCPWEGESWINDAAFAARNLLNVCSLRDNYNYEAAIEQLVYPANSPADVEGILRGERYIITAPIELTWQPFSLSCSGKAADILRQQIIDHRDEIHRMLIQRLINTSAGADAASGLSKQTDFQATNTALSDLADELERAEKKLHEFNAIYSGGGDNVEIKYPDDFNLDALDVAIRRAIEIDSLDVPDELRALMVETIFDRMMTSGIDPARAREIREAITAHFEEPREPEGGAAIEGIPTQTGAVNPGQNTRTPAVNGGKARLG